MAGILPWPVTVAQACLLALGCAVVALLAVVCYRAWKKSRISAEEWERRRRLLIATRGKLGDAVLVEVREDVLFFTYAVRGVEYTASQDISALREFMPRDLSPTGAVGVKYLPANPANSIVLAEDWTGLGKRTK